MMKTVATTNKRQHQSTALVILAAGTADAALHRVLCTAALLLHCPFADPVSPKGLPTEEVLAPLFKGKGASAVFHLTRLLRVPRPQAGLHLLAGTSEETRQPSCRSRRQVLPGF